MSQNNSFLSVTEYITPLREGGSLPAIVRAEDEKLYVLKFHGAGQGPKVLIAEWIAGEIARRLGFNMPGLQPLYLDPAIGKSEPDAEIQDLLQASEGINLGMAFIEGAATFNLLSPPHPTAEFAADLVWFDAFVSNVDRTPRNVNMLVRQDTIWLIDHGAALNFHYMWSDPFQQSLSPFKPISQHVLLPAAGPVSDAGKRLKPKLDKSFLQDVIEKIPEDWLSAERASREWRDGYIAYLTHRLQNAAVFEEEAESARQATL